jgi:hypothetical protein
MPNNIRIKSENHFKVEIRFKDTAVFENELNEKKVDFFSDYKNESTSDSLIQYFLLRKDKAAVDAFLQSNEIVVNSKMLQFENLNKERNFTRIYLRFVGLFIMLMMMLEAIEIFLKP